tara:strand:- start:223 stop:582 length:360 start_codon:yes stop_codon:yes gene_type:complete
MGTIMVSLVVDECYAFDFLSILEVKYEESKNDVIKEKLNFCFKDLSQKISQFDTIYNSLEYKAVKDANRVIFDAVEHAKENLVNAKYVDECNYKRYIVKKILQEKYFGNMSETKLGYEE